MSAIGLVAFCTSCFATNLTRNNAYLIHATNIFPTNGEMIAGSIPKASMGNIPIDDARLFVAAQRSLPQWRNTLHWCLNSFVVPHSLENAMEINRNQYPYVVIAPLSEFDSIVSGYWQDVVTIGGHRLGPNSVILVPENDTSYNQKVGRFQGTIIPYSGIVGDVVNARLMAYNAPVFKVNVPAGTLLNTRTHLMPESQVMEVYNSNTIIVPSSVISTAIGLDNTLFLDTRFGALQRQVAELFKYVRNFRTAREFGVCSQGYLALYNSLDKRQLDSTFIKDTLIKLTSLRMSYSNNQVIATNLQHWENFITLWAYNIYTAQAGVVHTEESLVALMDRIQYVIDHEGYGQRVSHPQDSLQVVVLQTCNNCGHPANLGSTLKVCSKCKKTHYCSTECQRADWPKHKPVCSSHL